MGQTFVISLGYQQFTDSTTKATYPKTGIGLKTSFVRAPWDAATVSNYNALAHLQDSLVYLDSMAHFQMLNDPTVVKLLQKR